MKHLLVPSLLAVALTSASWVSHAASPAQWQSMTAQLSVSMEAAIAQALRAAPGQPIEVELDDGDGQGARYEVDILTAAGESVEVWVHGASGQTQVHAHQGKAKRKDLERVQAAKIDMPTAIQAATTHTPGRAVKAELDSHWGTTTYQVDVLQPDYSVIELKVDAANGTILRAKKD